MVITFITVAKFYVVMHVLIIACMALILAITKVDSTKVSNDLGSLFDREQWDAAERYLNDGVKNSAVKEWILPLLAERGRPWRINMVYDENIIQWRSRYELYTVGYYVKKVIDIGVLVAEAYLMTTAQPESYGWVVAMVVAWGIGNIMIFRFLMRFAEFHKTIVKTRNRLFLALDYVPAEYRGHETRSQAELEAWNTEVFNMEGELLAGRHPDECSAASIRRMKENYAHRVMNPDADPLPGSRLGMLMNDDAG